MKAAAAGVKELKDGASKAASSLKSHVQARQRAGQKKRQADIKLQEQSEVQEKRKQAKLAAEQIKQQETVLPPILNLDWKAIADGVDDKCVRGSADEWPGQEVHQNLGHPGLHRQLHSHQRLPEESKGEVKCVSPGKET